MFYRPQDSGVDTCVPGQLFCVGAVMLPVTIGDRAEFAYVGNENFVPLT